MSMKLYVGSLPYEVTDAELNKLFSETGTIESASVITDRATGRSKGFAFVEMSTDEEAKQAIEKFNGYSLSGRNIVVNEARPKTETRGAFGSGGGYRPGGYQSR